MPIRIGIAGIAGRMGRLLAEEALAAGAALAGGTSRQAAVGRGARRRSCPTSPRCSPPATW